MKRKKIVEDPRILALFDVLRATLTQPHSREKVALALKGLLSCVPVNQVEPFASELADRWCSKDSLQEDLHHPPSQRAFSLLFEVLLEMASDESLGSLERMHACRKVAEARYKLLLSSLAFPTMEALVPVVKRVATYREEKDPPFQIPNLRRILSDSLSYDVAGGPILARVDSAIRLFSGWTEWFPSVPDDLQPDSLKLSPGCRPIWNAKHDGFAREQMRALAKETLDRWMFWPPSTSDVGITAKYAANAVCLHMIAAPSARALQELDAESFEKLLACQRFAHQNGVTIAPHLSSYQEERWRQPGREVQPFLKHLDEEFKRVFDISPEMSRRQPPTDLQLSLSRVSEQTDTFPRIWLAGGNRFQSYICGLLGSGSWGPARDLLRGTSWTGVYTWNIHGTEDPLSEEGTLFYLRLFSVPAMYLAYRGECYGVAAALGQMLLAEHRTPHPPRTLGDHNVSVITRAAELIAATSAGSVDEATRTFTQEILAMINRCMEKSLETRKPLWLDLL